MTPEQLEKRLRRLEKRLCCISQGSKSFVGVLSQTGTSAPVVVVLENTLGGDIAWTRMSAGYYHGTLAGAFTVNKTITPFASEYGGISVLSAPIWDLTNIVGYMTYYSDGSTNVINIDVTDLAGVSTDLSTLIGTSTLPITIKVYS